MFDLRQLTPVLEKYKLHNNYYEGYVVNNNDPNQCSRVKVLVQGITLKQRKDGTVEQLDEKDLPWYATLQAFGDGANSGTNVPPVDSRVLVVFPTDDIYNGVVVCQVTSIPPKGITDTNINYRTLNNENNQGGYNGSGQSNSPSGGDTSNNSSSVASGSNISIDGNGSIVSTGQDGGATPAVSVDSPSTMKRVYTQPDGTKVVKEGGTKAWRNNNEGNIRYGAYAKSKGAIGQDKDGFAIFPNEETGRKAKEDLIFEGKNYKDKNLDDAIYRYAPPSENNTKLYQSKVLASVNNQNKKMSEYTPEERQSILASMKKMEGYKAGKTYTETT